MFDKIRNQFPDGKFLSAEITGGGISFFDKLISPGGSSRFFYRGGIPYGVGSTPTVQYGKAVSSLMAIALAKKAYCSTLDDGINDAVGLGATFSLHKDGEREKRINHGHVCVRQNKLCVLYYIVFDKTVLNTREKQEAAAADIMAQTIVRCVIDKNHIVKYDGATIEY